MFKKYRYRHRYRSIL